MKSFLIITLGMMLGSAALVMGQNPSPANGQTLGRGRGGAPFAWNDKDKDGICDLTGKAVGQGRPGAGMRGCCRGRGARAAWGRGMGRGFHGQTRQTPPAPAQK